MTTLPPSPPLLPVVRAQEVAFLGPLLIALGAVMVLVVGVVSLRVWRQQRKVRPRRESTARPSSRSVSEKSSQPSPQPPPPPPPPANSTLDADPCTNEAEKIESGVYLHHARV